MPWPSWHFVDSHKRCHGSFPGSTEGKVNLKVHNPAIEHGHGATHKVWKCFLLERVVSDVSVVIRITQIQKSSHIMQWQFTIPSVSWRIYSDSLDLFAIGSYRSFPPQKKAHSILTSTINQHPSFANNSWHRKFPEKTPPYNLHGQWKALG